MEMPKWEGNATSMYQIKKKTVQCVLNQKEKKKGSCASSGKETFCSNINTFQCGAWGFSIGKGSTLSTV